MRKLNTLICLVLVVFLSLTPISVSAVHIQENQASANNLDAFLNAAVDAYEAPLSEAGITSSIDDDGHLVVLQVLHKPDTYSLNSQDACTEMAVTSVVLADAEGHAANDVTISDYRTGSGSNSAYQVYATHTMYFTLTGNMMATLRIRMSSMTTTLHFGTALRPQKLEHTYIGYRDFAGSDYESSTQTVYSPSENTPYNYYPNASDFPTGSGCPGGCIKSRAAIYCGSEVTYIELTVNLQNIRLEDYLH